MAETAALPPAQQFLAWVKHRGHELRHGDIPSASVADWEKRKAEIRAGLLQAWGGFPEKPCDLAPKSMGVLQRDGYRVEKFAFQTRPGIWMTSNLYLPEKSGKLPAVLCVHGHWRGAKQDPAVQARCIGLAKLGFVVLAVDAFGAGERGLGKALGEYHGEMVAATLLPVGLPLSGLQVYENMRAVDFLLTRPEVDETKLGVTGASGGGNQTMYAGAFDERFGCVVPVCSVGNYQAYLGAACCMCEVVPGALTFTEEGGILSLVAPRALMVINATRDAHQFSVGEAQKSIAWAQHIFRLYGKAGKIKHDIFESPHDYGKTMRESMYGWMTLHLKGEGQGNPIPEPEHKTEDPETLRCSPGDSRPEDFVTLPKFAAAEGRQLVLNAAREKVMHAEHWDSIVERLKHSLVKHVVKSWPAETGSRAKVTTSTPMMSAWDLETEPGITISAQLHRVPTHPGQVAVILDLDGTKHALEQPVVKQLAEAGWSRLHLDLRGTGTYAVAGDQIGRAPDHNSWEWSAWTGRPLLGQWMVDVRRAVEELRQLDAMAGQRITLVGIGSAGVLALAVTPLLSGVERVVTVGSLASYISDRPYTQQRMGILSPGILRDVGDVPRIAALMAPKPLIIAGCVNGAGEPLTAGAANENWEFTKSIYTIQKAEAKLSILSDTNPAAIVKAMDENG